METAINENELAAAVAEVEEAIGEPQVAEQEVTKKKRIKKDKSDSRKTDTSEKSKKSSRRKVKEQPKTVEEWLEARIKEPSVFTLSSEGNLVAPAVKSGESEIILDCPQYYNASKGQIQNLLQKRSEKISELKIKYSKARRNLFEIYKEYKAGIATIDQVLTANKEVSEAEQELLMTATSGRAVRIAMPDPMARDLLPEEKKSDKKVSDSVYIVDKYRYSWDLFFTDKPPEIELEPAAPVEVSALPEPQPTDEASAAARTGAIIGQRRRIKK